MIPRPTIRINPFEEQGFEFEQGFGQYPSFIDDRTPPATDLIPPADYPLEDSSTGHDQIRTRSDVSDQVRSDVMGTTPAYYDYHSPYSAPLPRYHYVTYQQPDIIPRSDPLYDPYYYSHPGYHPDYYSATTGRNIYRIPPGTGFDMVRYDGQADRERFEVESVTGQGLPHHVRKTTTGERFVVEPPLPSGSDTGRGVHGESSRERRRPGGPRDRNAVAVHTPKFRHHPPPRETDGSTSSYTEASIQTRSGPHFMNGVDYLDVSTRSRILTWLNKSSEGPIRLRPVSGDVHVDSTTGEPLRFRTSQQGNH